MARSSAASLPADPSPTAYAWYVACLLALAHLVSFIDRYLMSLVMEPLKADLGVSDTQLGLLQGTGFVILYAVAAVPLGQLADRINRRNLIIAGIVFWSLSTAACGLAGSFGWLFAARVGVGLGEAALVPAAMSLLATYFPPDRLGRAVSLFTMGASLGKSAALIGGGAILALLVAAGGLLLPGVGLLEPWQGTFVLASIPGVALALLLLTVKEPARPASPLARPGLRSALAHIGRFRAAYGRHTLAAVSTVLLIQSLAAWATSFYVRFFAMTPAEAGIMVGSIILIAGPAGHLTGGYLTDRFQRAGAQGAVDVVIGAGLLAAIPCAILFTGAREIGLSIAAYGALNYFLTLAAPASLAGIQMMTPDRLRGVVSALFLSVATLVGIGFGPTLVGLLTDQLFEDPLALDRSLRLVILAFCAIGFVAAWAARVPVGRAIDAVAAERRTAIH